MVQNNPAAKCLIINNYDDDDDDDGGGGGGGGGGAGGGGGGQTEAVMAVNLILGSRPLASTTKITRAPACHQILLQEETFETHVNEIYGILQYLTSYDRIRHEQVKGLAGHLFHPNVTSLDVDISELLVKALEVERNRHHQEC